MAATTSEMVWLCQLLHDFCIEAPNPALLFCDNQAAIHVASNLIFYERTKHIEINCHFVRDKVTDGFFEAYACLFSTSIS